ncbi:E3 ubiquitin-protein ligase TRIM33 isoform X3 [Nilaparvata lugens]|uniref:E3 ubiquitin-protein ligase TRIM33 isoform X3 n=1 Tax=Nilaparvata lugens TaxID=108931 RepID=UPI00193DDCA7|nr:E3 ubiquitin-protein ligase TRIM33 isoform X3 [Nilaparvata lugens]
MNEETNWLGNSPYVSFLDRDDDESRRIDAFNFELAKKRSLEDYLNKVKKKKMLNEEGTLLKDKTTTKSSERESDNVVDLISPVSSKVQDEVRKRKRKKLPFVKYSTEKPSQKNADDERNSSLLDTSFCVTDDSSVCRTADEIDTITTEKQDELCESLDQDMSLSTEIEIRKEKQQSDEIQTTEKQVENVGNFDSFVPFPTAIEKRVGVDECEEQNVSEKSKQQSSSVLSLSSGENVEIPKRNTLHLSHTGTLIQSKPVCKRLSKNKRILIRKIYGYRVIGKGNRTMRLHDDKTTSSISAAMNMKMDHEQANSAEVSAKRPPPVIKIKTEPELATAAAAASGNSSSSSSSSSSNGSEEITASMAASASDTTPANPWTSTKCIFCGQMLSANDDPKLLECLHAACKHCITSRLKENPILEADGIATDNIVRCPRCLVNCRQSMIIDNLFLSECLATSGVVGGGGADGGDGTESGEQRMGDLKCGSCAETGVTSWCVECAEFICDICVQAHMRLKITKDHTIKPKEEAEPESNAAHQGALPKSQLCSVHRQERLTLFCEACDRLTCRDCQLTTHRDHKYKFINEIAAETRTLISGLLSEVTYKRVLLKSAMKVIDDRQRLILEKRKELVNDITEMVVKLTNTINTRGKQLVVRLNDVCDAKQQTLNEKKQALDQLSNLTDDCIEFVNNALDQGSDMALLASKTNLTAHLQRIKSRRADIPNPEIPVRISLCLDKVPELIKVASSIGSIMVDGRTYPPSSSSGGSSTPSPAAAGSGAARLATPPAAVPPINIKTEAGHKGHPPAYESVAPPPPLQQAPSLAGGGAQAAAILGPQHQQQQLMSRHYTSPPQQQMSPAAVYQQQQSRTSPLQSMAQMPQQIARNLQQRVHHNQGAVSMTRVGGGPHQQQVTSSTDGGARGVGGGDGGLRSMLSLHYHQQQQHQQHQQQLQQQQLHQQQQAAHQQFMANHAMRTTSPQNPQIYVQHRLGGGAPNVIVTASSTQPGYLPPPQGHPPHMVAAQPRYPSPYQAQNSPAKETSKRLSSPSIVHRFFDLSRKSSKFRTIAQQTHSRPPAGSYSSTARQLVQRVQSPHSSNQQQQSRQSQSPAAATAGILWHIPQSQAAAAKQQSQSSTSAVAAPPPPPLIQLPLDQDTSFKITLKQQINSQAAPSSGSKTPAAGGTSGTGGAGGGVAVTSSVPKTPSPRLSTKASDDAEKCLDKFCQDSVNDLMMTIAKLDSQGTEMIPEVVGGETNGTPQVDSSTDSSAVTPSPLPRPASTSNTQESQKDDPNEDWCAVCLDGGEPVLCCDYCPKVFHIKCHIPRIPDFPEIWKHESDPWQCLLCTDMVPLSNKVAEAGVKRKASTALTSEEQKLVERILLELYCQYDPSLHFREIVSPENTGYYEVIKKPMSFEKVRQKLDPADTTVEKYTCVEDVISDIRLIFKNAYIYNSINSQVYTDAKTLEELLDQMLEKWIPALAAEPGSTPSANNQPAEEEEAVAEEEAAAEEEAEDDEEEDEEDEENEDGHPPAAKRVRRAVSD